MFVFYQIELQYQWIQPLPMSGLDKNTERAWCVRQLKMLHPDRLVMDQISCESQNWNTLIDCSDSIHWGLWRLQGHLVLLLWKLLWWWAGSSQGVQWPLCMLQNQTSCCCAVVFQSSNLQQPEECFCHQSVYPYSQHSSRKNLVQLDWSVWPMRQSLNQYQDETLEMSN